MNTSLLLTSTFYGNWLPGSERGFVRRVRERREGDDSEEKRHVHNIPGTIYDEDMPGLEDACEQQMRGPPILLNREQADGLFAQFQETANYRKWKLCAVAIRPITCISLCKRRVSPTRRKCLVLSRLMAAVR